MATQCERMLLELAPNECVVAPTGWCSRPDHDHDQPVVDMECLRATLRRLNAAPGSSARAPGGAVKP